MCFCPYRLQFPSASFGALYYSWPYNIWACLHDGKCCLWSTGKSTVRWELPCLVQDRLVGEFVEEISCGAYHVAVLTSRSEVFTWGREPVKYLEVKSAKAGTKTDSYSIVRASQVPALLQLTDIAFPSSLSALQYAFKPPPQPQPPPRSGGNSRSSSPYSRRPNPPRSATPVFSRGVIDSLKKTNDLLSQEVTKLQSQIKSLKQKSEVQDEEIQKLQKNAQEATFLADQESSKFIVANEVMKSVASQLKEIAGKFPPEMPMSDTLEDINAQFETFFLSTNRDAVSESRSSLPVDLAFDQRHESADRQYRRTEDNLDVTGVSDVSQNGEDTPRHSNRSSNIREALHLESNESAAGSPKSPKCEGQREVIEQFEPGVYVTLIQLHNGTKIFKRVRFSKRRFAEQQAEEWWMGNKDRLLKKYNPSVANSASTGSSTIPTASDENDEAAPSS
ncbi:hypothetical protein Vadar_034550 [Vaccinium darrowii]|uniref:Uncharacterized protein n=1 Tax=Vaccinium darrowii TaxID=229202 RepID=A0ACB7Z0H6_9ERIC|nr:hypothetical protein Vadar_034550 [Vaccinium darrowii]